MKFEVTLKELEFEDGNGGSFDIDLEGEIVASIKDEIYYKLKKDILEKIGDEISKTVASKIKSSANDMIQERLFEFSKTEKIIIGREKCTIKELVTKEFNKFSSWNNPTETIKSLVKILGEELKQRYDLLFASQLISKINDLGYLKPGVEKILLQNDNKNEDDVS